MTDKTSRVLILQSFWGKYYWWPILQVVDFKPYKRVKTFQIATLPVNKNTVYDALKQAVVHLQEQLKLAEKDVQRIKEQQADKILAMETLGLTHSWRED